MIKPFEPIYVSYLNILKEIVANPPSDAMIDISLIKLMLKRLESDNNPSAVVVWNWYKEFLDVIVHSCCAAPAIHTLMNLEPYYLPPDSPDTFSIKAGNMHLAPWRTNSDSI